MLDCTPTFRVFPEAVNVPSPEASEAEFSTLAEEDTPADEAPPHAVRPVITVTANTIANILL